MLERLTDLPDQVHGLRAKGKVTREDYLQTFRPLLEEARSAGRPIRFLYHAPEGYGGVSLDGIWEGKRIGWQLLRYIERYALVTDTKWIHQSVPVFASLVPFPVRVFANDKWDEALDWLSAPSRAHHLSHTLHADRGVLVVEIRGPLDTADIEAIATTVDPWIESHGALGGLVLRAKSFPGWENMGSAIRHLRFVRDHHRKIRRVAIAADGKLAELAPQIAEFLVAAKLKHFDFDELDDAIAWASEEPPSPSSKKETVARQQRAPRPSTP